MSKEKLPALMAGVLGGGLFALYAATAATGIVPGDPAEYTFVAHLMGIAHPPGYAFMTLLTKAWQTLVPIGSIAQRSHLLAAAAGALTSALVFGAVWQIESKRATRPSLLPPLFAALTVAVAADHWQHSIHVNSHMVTVTLNTLAIFLLLRWWRTDQDRWLYAFSAVAGLGPTHHPLTVLSFPAYLLFIIIVRPGIINVTSRGWWREKRWRTPRNMLLFGLLGLAVWLYYPIRSPMKPDFGPHDMDTLDGFLNVALARGLRVNLFHFGLAERGQRLLVFWTLLRQQFALPVILLAAGGLVSLPARALFGSKAGRAGGPQWGLVALIAVAFLGPLVFIINSVQDVMAYLLTPFMLVGLMAGLGAGALMHWAEDTASGNASLRRDWPLARMRRYAPLVLWIGLLVLPALSLAQNVSRISLRGYQAGDEYVAAVFERFEGSGEEAILLNDWEHITPLWYSRYVDGRWPDPTDVIPSMVSTDRPWVERVYEHLPDGPVYLSGYRREIVDVGFRLRPEGRFYRVVEPGDTRLDAQFRPLRSIPNQPVELLGYWLPSAKVGAGGIVALDLAMRAPVTTTEYLVPYAEVGAIHYPFTTDNHLLTPLWLPNEVIIERFSFALPFDLPAGRYPLSIGLANLSTGIRSELVPVQEIAVTADPSVPRTELMESLLANFGQRVGVDRVSVSGAGSRRTAVWSDALVARPGDELNIVIKWRCLAPIEESYTVFVHLMDAGNRLWDQTDYTPLGGSYPTHLWIPKWLPGQTALDPYRLVIPAGAPPGDYYLEIGLYGMTTRRRVYQYDPAGNLVGDRLVLGWIHVQ